MNISLPPYNFIHVDLYLFALTLIKLINNTNTRQLSTAHHISPVGQDWAGLSVSEQQQKSVLGLL
jgi:hypothetical protein